jgi:hypothetical protein
VPRPGYAGALLTEKLGLLGRELAVGEDALAVQLAKLGQQASRYSIPAPGHSAARNRNG